MTREISSKFGRRTQFAPTGLVQIFAGDSWLLPQSHTLCVTAPSVRERYAVCKL